MSGISNRVQGFTESVIREMTRVNNEHKGINLAQGMPNKTIARQLGLAPSTVKNRLTAVFERLGVANRTQAAMAARSIVSPAEPSTH